MMALAETSARFILQWPVFSVLSCAASQILGGTTRGRRKERGKGGAGSRGISPASHVEGLYFGGRGRWW
jgi:hypothetical protein